MVVPKYAKCPTCKSELERVRTTDFVCPACGANLLRNTAQTKKLWALMAFFIWLVLIFPFVSIWLLVVGICGMIAVIMFAIFDKSPYWVLRN
jgi:predicted RNA-binding Zn-ribbon protein involved in translation (DUF1610 family)